MKKEINDKDILPSRIRLVYSNLTSEVYGPYGPIRQRLDIKTATGHPMTIPRGLDLEDAFDVVSYVFDETVDQMGFAAIIEDPAAFITRMSKRLSSNFGFRENKNFSRSLDSERRKLTYSKIKNIDIPLEKLPLTQDIVMDFGDSRLFEKSNLFRNAANWYSDDISQSKIYDIRMKLSKYIQDNNDEDADLDDEKGND